MLKPLAAAVPGEGQLSMEAKISLAGSNPALAAPPGATKLNPVPPLE
jgi:hypothetical protein